MDMDTFAAMMSHGIPARPLKFLRVDVQPVPNLFAKVGAVKF